MALLDHIYEAVSDDEAFETLPAAVAAAVGARSCVIFGYDNELRLQVAAKSYFTQEMIDYQRAPEFQPIDIWATYGAQPHRIGRVSDSDDVWDQPEFLRSPYFNECIRQFGDDTVRCLGSVTCAADGYLSIGVHTGLGERRFDERDAATLGSHIPHIFRMMDLRARLDLTRAKGDLLQRALDQAPAGVLAVDRNMRVMVSNRQAAAILAAADGLRVINGRIMTADQRLQERLAHAVRSAANWANGRGDAILINRVGALPAYRVLVSPINTHPSAALLVVEDPADRDPSLAASLANLFGLTASEAELAVLLADGHTPEEAAEARDVRLSTVRTQIKSLLDKTEARRLTDLIRILARAPRRPS